MSERLEAARGRKFVGVSELAQEAAGILAESGLAQERGTVTELPDERTIRYYLAEGLVSAAEEKQGTASVFGFRQLLQLLVVKRLQAERLSIRAIKELVAGKSERQLEKLIGGELEGGTRPGGKTEALNYLESILTKAAPRAAPPSPAATAPVRASAAAGTASVSGRETWARVEIEPGLEVHVSDSYRAPRGDGLRRLAQIFLDVLQSRGGKSPRRKGR